MIPLFLYPIFKRHNEVLALGAVLFRGVFEAVCYTGMVISMFLLLTVSQLYAKTGAVDVVNLQTLGTTLIATVNWVN